MDVSYFQAKYSLLTMRGSKNVRQGGGGGAPGSSVKKSSENCFSPQFILQKSNGLFQRNRGPQHFPGVGSNFFHGGGGGGGGVRLLILYRLPI